MFRQEELIFGGWHEMTVEAMQKRRFEKLVSALPPLGAERLNMLEPGAFKRRIERCWQDIEYKPMRAQQMNEVWKHVLNNIELQADCLSREEHDLVERMLVLEGCAQLEDVQELEAARALSLRLWANVGLVSGKPYIELEAPVLRQVAKAFARAEHENIRRSLEEFDARLKGVLYRVGVLDDRIPQQKLIRDVLQGTGAQEALVQAARRYLWASCDCVDYHGGVMLVHPALAEPFRMINTGSRRKFNAQLTDEWMTVRFDILPEEIPLQRNLERAIEGALRDGYHADETARTLRFLCKQGAPLDALVDVLQQSLIVCVSSSMRSALADMYYQLPKWMECAETPSIQ